MFNGTYRTGAAGAEVKYYAPISFAGDVKRITIGADKKEFGSTAQVKLEIEHSTDQVNFEALETLVPFTSTTGYDVAVTTADFGPYARLAMTVDSTGSTDTHVTIRVTASGKPF